MLTQRKFVKLVVEALEDRTVPATLVSPTTLTFQDVDGDIAAVVFSKPVLGENGVNYMFEFDTGSVNGSNVQRQSLRKITLAPFTADINGVDMTVKVLSRARGGDGEVHVGEVFSVGFQFGKLDFQGDVGAMTMFRYDGDRKLADSISMNSTGRFDPTATSQSLRLSGYVGTLLVRGDLSGYMVAGYNDNDGDFSKPIIGTMEVRGNVRGYFFTGDRIDSVLIRGNIGGTASAGLPVFGTFSASAVGTFNLQGSVIGSNMNFSGLGLGDDGVSTLGKVTIGGSIRGDLGAASTTVFGRYESITVKGGIVGGTQDYSGQLTFSGPRSVLVEGSVIGGAGSQSGYVGLSLFGVTNGEVIENLHIKGSVLGGSGQQSGSLNIANPVKRLTVGGKIQGGTGTSSGRVFVNGNATNVVVQSINGGTGGGSGTLELQDYVGGMFALQTVVVNGSVIGGSGGGSGGVFVRGVSKVNINGSVIGGSSFTSGSVSLSFGEPGAPESSLFVQGSVKGGAGDLSGNLFLFTEKARVSILGDIVGGQGLHSGGMTSSAYFSSLSVAGSLLGGSGRGSASMDSTQGADAVRIGKSIVGGSGPASGFLSFEQGTVKQLSVGGSVVGGKGDSSGVIRGKVIQDVRIGGSVVGSDGQLAGGINVREQLGAVKIDGSLTGNFGYIFAGIYLGQGYIDSVWIGGDIRSSAIISSGALGSITVKGSITGTAALPSYITANGVTPDSGLPNGPVLLKSLRVDGDVKETFFYLGNFAFNNVILSAARVGTISVGKNWSNNLLLVGFGAGQDGVWGTDDDVPTSPGEASVIDGLFIGGKVLGSRTSTVLAGEVSQLKIGGSQVGLNPGAFNDDLLIGLLRVWEKA